MIVEGSGSFALRSLHRIPAGIYRTMRRLFERLLRKMYRLDRSLDLSPNQLVVLAHASPATRR
jgi:hypothetical protein